MATNPRSTDASRGEASEERTARTVDGPADLLREPLMQDIVELAMLLDENDRSLLLDMMIAMLAHKKRYSA